MHSIKQQFTIIFLGAILIAFSACEDLLETTPPESVLPEDVLSNLEGMEGIVTSFHDRLNAVAFYGRQLMLYTDIMADNTDQHPITSGRGDNLAINSHGAHFTLYGSAYNAINEANYLIDGIDHLENVAEWKRNFLLGSAYFFRALSYHSLVKIYAYEPGREVDGWDAGVVLRTEPTRTDVDAMTDQPRATNKEVYEVIVSDLEKAIELLPEDMDSYDVDFANGTWRNPIFWANHQTAVGLMARVQLYLEEWELAKDYATQAMDVTTAVLVGADDYYDSWNSYPQQNPEAMFLSIAASSGTDGGLAGWTQPRYQFDIVPSQSLIDSYEEDDVRLEFFDVHTDGFPVFTKWSGRNDDTSTDDVPVMRYPELLLIRAEAYAELGQSALATDDLNTLRDARGLGSLTTISNKENLIQEVMDERRRELAWEGHRWFDFKRRGEDIPKQGTLGDIDYEDYRVLSPYPTSEVEDFPSIEQNPGY